MQISLSKFLGVVTGVVALGILGWYLYFSYNLFFAGEKVEDIPTIQSINVGILGPKAQKAAAALVNASEKIALKRKDIGYIDGTLYKSFTDIPDTVPLSDSRGRPDPFIPYVAP